MTALPVGLRSPSPCPVSAAARKVRIVGCFAGARPRCRQACDRRLCAPSAAGRPVELVVGAWTPRATRSVRWPSRRDGTAPGPSPEGATDAERPTGRRVGRAMASLPDVRGAPFVRERAGLVVNGAHEHAFMNRSGRRQPRPGLVVGAGMGGADGERSKVWTCFTVSRGSWSSLARARSTWGGVPRSDDVLLADPRSSRPRRSRRNTEAASHAVAWSRPLGPSRWVTRRSRGGRPRRHQN